MSEQTEKPKRAVPKSRTMMNDMMSRMFEQAFEAKKNGIPVGWGSSISPQELTTTLGLPVMYPENHSAALGAKRDALRMLEHSESIGYSNDICAYARVSLAYKDLKDSPAQNIPQPDFLIITNNICNVLFKWYENLSKDLNIPLIVIDVPYNYDPTFTPAKLDYVKGQMDEAIKQLEKIAGKKFDYDKFNEVMEISKENAKLWVESLSYNSNIPSPTNGFDVFNFMALIVMCRGMKETGDVFRQMITESKEHIANGTSDFPGEKYRIHWDGIACFPHMGHNLKTLRSFGINMVSSGYPKAWALTYENYDDMLSYYAQVSNNVNIDAQVQRRVEYLKQFKVDGMIYHMNRSCKVMDFQQYEVQRRVYEATGVPFVSFDGDQADPRNYTEAQFETRIQGLVEVMEARKQKLAGVAL